MNFFIGILEDNLAYFSLVQLFKNYGTGHILALNFPYGVFFNLLPSNQPLSNSLFVLLGSLGNFILVYNLIIVFALLLTTSCAYLLLKQFIENKVICLMLALVFILSPYFLYHARSHIDLIQVWALILTLLSFIRAKKTSHIGLSAILLAITTAFSNYLGYTGLIFLSLLMLFDGILNFRDTAFLKKFIIKSLVFYTVFFVTTSTYLYPYIKFNYTSQVSPTIKKIDRSLDEFIMFSSRPWYFVLPPQDNPFFGDTTRKVIDQLQTKWGYWLTYGYFPSEHSTSFLGLTNLILAGIGLYAVKKHSKRKQLLALLFAAIVLALLSMPPYITINLYKIYTPSYLLWKFFPMFRVLTRFNLVTLLITLVFSGIGLGQISQKLSNKKTYLYGSLLLLFALSISEFWVPLKLTKVLKPPRAYTYLGSLSDKNAVIAVYPFAKAREAIFWMSTYNKPLMNPANGDLPEYDFNAEQFTDELTTCEGLANMKKNGGTHLVTFGEFPSDLFSNKNVVTFPSVSERKRDSDNKFYRIEEIGEIGELQSIYDLRDALPCKSETETEL